VELEALLTAWNNCEILESHRFFGAFFSLRASEGRRNVTDSTLKFLYKKFLC
jgi:hypothetical protein